MASRGSTSSCRGALNGRAAVWALRGLASKTARQRCGSPGRLFFFTRKMGQLAGPVWVLISPALSMSSTMACRARFPSAVNAYGGRCGSGLSSVSSTLKFCLRRGGARSNLLLKTSAKSPLRLSASTAIPDCESGDRLCNAHTLTSVGRGVRRTTASKSPAANAASMSS